MSYLLEGAGRAVRDNSLSDTDTFTYAGICARLSDNAQEQKYLRKTITGYPPFGNWYGGLCR